MKTKTLIVGSVLVAVGVGAYFFLIKNKNAGTGIISNSLTKIGGGAGTSNSGTNSASQNQNNTAHPATIDEIAQNQNQIIEQNKYQQVLNIQTKYTNGLYFDCPPKQSGWHQSWEYETCISSKKQNAVAKINKEINPLGYKLSNGIEPLSEIVKLTL